MEEKPCKISTFTHLDTAANTLAQDALTQSVNELKEEYHEREKMAGDTPAAKWKASTDPREEWRLCTPLENATTVLVADVLNQAAMEVEDDYHSHVKHAPLAAKAKAAQDDKEITEDYHMDEKTAPGPIEVEGILATLPGNKAAINVDEPAAPPAPMATDENADSLDEETGVGKSGEKRRKSRFQKTMKGVRKRLDRLVVCGKKEL